MATQPDQRTFLAELPEPERSRHRRAVPDAPTGPASTVAIERLIAAVERRCRRAPTTRDV